MSIKYGGRFLLILVAALSVPLSALRAQAQRTLAGNTHPLAQARYDRGPVDPDMKLEHITLTLTRSTAQQAAIDRFIGQQQDKTSPLYHKWLTPEQFADRFGRSQEEIGRVKNWLEASGFSIVQVARGRGYIVFSGTSGQVESALHTPIHHFQVEGEVHYANATNPSVPEELADLVAGFRGLDDFYPKPSKHQQFDPVKADGPLTPEFVTQKYPGVNLLAPADLATIYDINALYGAGINGAGQTLAIVGGSAIYLSDIESFRALFQLPFNDPIPVLVGPQPGIQPDALSEADLDLEWAGAIAPNATIFYVYSQNVFDAIAYAIDDNVAPVLSSSIGECELGLSPNDVHALVNVAQQAVAQGITWVASSGDSGAAGCENQNGKAWSATTPVSVDIPASIPLVTGVGGTEFNEGYGRYFGSLNSNLGSAVSYIPEIAWNDEAQILQNGSSGFSASGGGASVYFLKPSWQAGPGVPNDGVRDVPDVAFTSSPNHDPYFVVSNGGYVPTGGTSAAAPVFAGIVTMLNQIVVVAGFEPGLGNLNPFLYALAQAAPASFHDITIGSNVVPCVIGSSQYCTTGYIGYSAGPGYDQVTGLGSVDAFATGLELYNALIAIQ